MGGGGGGALGVAPSLVLSGTPSRSSRFSTCHLSASTPPSPHPHHSKPLQGKHPVIPIFTLKPPAEPAMSNTLDRCAPNRRVADTRRRNRSAAGSGCLAGPGTSVRTVPSPGELEGTKPAPCVRCHSTMYCGCTPAGGPGASWPCSHPCPSVSHKLTRRPSHSHFLEKRPFGTERHPSALRGGHTCQVGGSTQISAFDVHLYKAIAASPSSAFVSWDC